MQALFGKYIVGKKVLGIQYDNDSIWVEVEGDNGTTIVLECNFAVNWREEQSELHTKVVRKKFVKEVLRS